ncbi:hypothetical protein [Citricoccus zhacaiensis]|uniref:hypothetical protein n=1 Tax=Citricoccus zhacaiensis TaxID=489142 RepID=UPI003CE95815
MDTFWEYFSVLAPSVGLGLIFWLVMRSLFRADSGERNARAELEEREAEEWARLRAERGSLDGAGGTAGETTADDAGDGRGAAPTTAS